ncbi:MULTISPECIES: type II secretion system F family protein [unclassified Agrococcus]|uniref:type II secretion system F family protein n=1 Tax=unclassified Agrococcus TaxID=2615065 RepID=UPI0036220B8A
MTPAMIGAGIVVLGIAIALLAVLQPTRTRLPRDRRRPAVREGEGALSGAADVASSVMARVIRSRASGLARSLDLAGLRMRPQDFAVLVVVGAVVLVAIGVVLGRGLLAIPMGASAVGFAYGFVRFRIAKRRKAFAGQLGSTMQLMSSSLRAGQSMMQALQSVARESDEPTAGELTRVVNETRVGRPIVDSLEEAADRMESVDFRWATQAIAINREVGGSLSDVLDGVAGTIRERDQIRRHVSALSAEGRLSAVILMGLPVVVALFLVFTNASYLSPFVEHPLGPILLGLCGLLMLVGGIWLKKTVEIRF